VRRVFAPSMGAGMFPRRAFQQVGKHGISWNGSRAGTGQIAGNVQERQLLVGYRIAFGR
jgi:hypothetical protein